MKFREASTHQLRAENRAHPPTLSTDAKFKKFWDDLADDWIALSESMGEINRDDANKH